MVVLGCTSNKRGSTWKPEIDRSRGGEEDRHGGKEVVNYWEDGLAIYADGTKEEGD